MWARKKNETSLGVVKYLSPNVKSIRKRYQGRVQEAFFPPHRVPCEQGKVKLLWVFVKAPPSITEVLGVNDVGSRHDKQQCRAWTIGTLVRSVYYSGRIFGTGLGLSSDLSAARFARSV